MPPGPLTAALLLAVSAAAPQEPAPRQQPAPLEPLSGRVDQPVELGQVRWYRDFAAGLTEADATGRPVLLLFQEVPG